MISKESSQEIISWLSSLSSTSLVPSLSSLLSSSSKDSIIQILSNFYLSTLLPYQPYLITSITSITKVFLFIFSPQRLFKQILATITLQSLIVIIHRIKSISEYFYSFISSYGYHNYQLKSKLKSVNEYYEWRRIAADIDELNNDIDWIEQDRSQLYDYKILKKRIQSIERMEYSRDTFGLMFRLRGALSRDQYGLLHEGLYSRAYSGTKRLVQLYNQTITSALNYICDYDEDSEV